MGDPLNDGPRRRRSRQHLRPCGHRGGRALAAAVLLVCGTLAAPGAAGGSSIQVLAAAARTGSFGARLSLAGCTAPPDLVLSGTVTTDQTACQTITSTADVSGTVTFTAGDLITFGNGSSVASGSSFRAVVDPAIKGDAYLQDDTPSAETSFRALFAVDPTAMSLPAAERFDHFVAYDHLGAPQLRVVVLHDAPLNEDRLVLEVRLDDGSFLSTAGMFELVLPAGWSTVEVDWRAASVPGVADGLAALCVNDDGSRSSCQTLGHDHAGRIDSIRWGAQGVDPGTTGSIDLDDFVSYRELPAGI